MDVTKVRMRSLLSALGSRHRVRAFDMLVFLIAPYMQALSPLPLVLFGVAAVSDGEVKSLLTILAGGAVLLWVGLTLFGLLLTKLGGYSLRMLAKSIVLFPVFMISWWPLQFISLFKRTTEWKVIGHGTHLPAEK